MGKIKGFLFAVRHREILMTDLGLITASDGKKYNVIYYSLEMILAIGYRVRSIRGVQFCQWATRHLSEYLVKGFTMDDDRLKNPDGRQRPQASRRSPCGSVD